MASGLETITFPGVPDGSNLSVPPHEIADTQARYIQDALLDNLGLCYRRGAVDAAFGVTTFSDAGVGVAQTFNPAGSHKVGVLHGSGSFGVLSDLYDTHTDLTWPETLSTSPYTIVDSKPSLKAGALIGTAPKYGVGTTQGLAHWRGAEKVDYTTGTVTITRGSKTVTGSGTTWSTAAGPGMFLFATADDPAGVSVFMGVVASVQTNTSLTLEANAPFAATAHAYKLTSIRGVCPHYAGGFITTQTTVPTVNGESTRWVGNGLGTGSWYLFRAADNAYIGKVSSVADDGTLTLTANAAVTMSVEHYYALRGDGSYAIDIATNGKRLGFLNAVYAQRQWYADGETLWFSEEDDFEGLDLDPEAGNFIPVTSQKPDTAGLPLTTVMPAANSLLLLKENEAFALLGNTPDTFELHKLYDDGALSGMSVQTYLGDTIFAGRDGIYVYDGTQVVNIIEDRLGSWYKQLVATFDPTTYRMWSMVVRDHYKLFIEAVTPTYSPRRGNVKTTPTRMTISIYLPTRAVTFDTNLDIRGSIEMPAQSGKGVWYLVNTSSGARICAGNDLFDVVSSPDTLTCVGNTAGPNLYIETKRYPLGDDLRKKLFKQLMLHYYVGGDSLKLDTVLGLNEEGITSLSEWVATIFTWDELPTLASTTWDGLISNYATWDSLGEPAFKVKRIKFLKRSQHIGFRIYQKSSGVTQAKLGPWAIGFKLQRMGRI